MTIEEMKARQALAYKRIERLEDGQSHEEMADGLGVAFDLLDAALSSAIQQLEALPNAKEER